MSINSSPYGPPQYFYLPPVNGSTPINRPISPPSVQAADTAVFTQQAPSKNTISVGKAAKYGALIGAASSLVSLGILLRSKGERELLKLRENRIPALIGTFLGMGIKSAEGALSGALLGYFLKRSEKQG